MRSIRRHLLVFAALVGLAPVLQAQSPAGVPLPAPPDTLRDRVLAEVKAPAGVGVSVFAAPPQLVYPACVEAAVTGEVFACVEPNLNFDRVRGRGRVVQLADLDADGVADRYSVFADSLDSVRGLVYDAGTLYVMHSPTLSAMRDTDGDGVADQREVLVRGLGFDLEDRGGDHTSNGLTLGIDGWLYLAVGDYGFVDAVGSDGHRLQLRGGGVVRVRPDGTELEIVVRGTRNIYGVALDPFLNIFARDNNNNGQGWGVRLHYLPEGANTGYPSLFRDFPDEVLAPLVDYGAGAGTGALWLQDPEFPAALDNSLYTADWGLNLVYRHPLRPRGASYEAGQEELLGIPRPTDLASDGGGNLYVASLSGGSFNYAGEHVGYLVRLRPTASTTAVLPALPTLAESRLLELLAGPSAPRRLAAQREILRRGATPALRRGVERLILAGEAPAYARVAGIFTLKQLLGPASHPLLLRAAEDPALRASALRALTDRRGEVAKLPEAVFVRALVDPDPKVRLRAINGLRRMQARGAAPSLMRSAASDDPVVSQVAIDALVELNAVDASLAALDAGSETMAIAALRVLQRLHSPPVVTALIERVATAPDARRGAILQALARLYQREGPWGGEWWDVQPSTDGPYYQPTTWSESARIRPVLESALLGADGGELAGLLHDFTRNQVLPRGADSLLVVLARTQDARRAEAVRALAGFRDLDPAALPLLAALANQNPRLADPVARLLAAQHAVGEVSAPLLRIAALDTALAAEVRVQALNALGRLPGSRGVTATAGAYAQLTSELGADSLLAQGWRRFVGDRRNAGEVSYFVELTRSGDAGDRELGYAVLVQIARTARNAPESRAAAAARIDSAWGEPAAASALVRAIERMGAGAEYSERLERYRAANPAR
jgi:glucose/arabinose dehydrogenase